MALIDVFVVRGTQSDSETMEDFEFAALNSGDRVNLPSLGDIFILKNKEVTRTDSAGSITTKYVLYF